MDSHLFRKGRWRILILSDNDANIHLSSVKFTQDTILIMKYFVFLLYEKSANIGTNEFSERHNEIKDAIIDVMHQKMDSGARQISALIEGIETKSLLNDGCITSGKPYPRWTASFHEHDEPKNFYQLLMALYGIQGHVLVESKTTRQRKKYFM